MNLTNRPQPVLVPQLALLAVALVAFCVAWGLPLTQEQVYATLNLAAILYPLAVAGLAWWSARKVTPSADPKADDGSVLVPEVNLGRKRL